MRKVKMFLIAVAEESWEVIRLFWSNLMKLAKIFWKQSWTKRGIDIAIALLVSFIYPPISLIAFNLSMASDIDKLNTFQLIIYLLGLGALTTLLFMNFAELFIILSLGGISIFNSAFYDSIKKRIDTYNAMQAAEMMP